MMFSVRAMDRTASILYLFDGFDTCNGSSVKQGILKVIESKVVHN